MPSRIGFPSSPRCAHCERFELYRPGLPIPYRPGVLPLGIDARHAITAGQKDLEYYTSEIARLQAKIASIEQSRKRLGEHLNLLWASMSGLPTEILEIIFGMVSESSSADLQKGRPTPWPLRLSAVCSHWRAVIVSSPRYWTNISISFGRDIAPKPDLVRLFLERSREQPLSLTILKKSEVLQSISSIFKLPVGSTLPRSLQLLVREAHRWRKLCISGESSEDLRFLRKLIAISFPKLEKLTIIGFGGQKQENLGFNELAPMPKLQILSIDNGPGCTIAEFPYCKQLTKLSLYGTQDILFMLQHCVNLRELLLCINLQIKQPSLASQQSPRRLLRLRKLTLLLRQVYERDSPSILRDSLKWLSLPALETLTIERDGSSSGSLHPVINWPEDIFSDFVAKYSRSISSLSLINICMSDTDLAVFLHKIPFLQSLTVQEPWFSDVNATNVSPCPVSSFFMQLLSEVRHPIHTLLPMLKTLDLTIHKEFDEATFSDMVQSRTQDEISVARLENVRLRVGKMGTYFGQKIDLKGLEWPQNQFVRRK